MTEKKTACDKEKANLKDMVSGDVSPGGELPGFNPSKNTKGGGCRFSKGQLLSSERFRDRRDILEALLVIGELYTVKAVEEKITSYMKGKVK